MRGINITPRFVNASIIAIGRQLINGDVKLTYIVSVATRPSSRLPFLVVKAVNGSGAANFPPPIDRTDAGGSRSACSRGILRLAR
ncbi:hypothetical protein KIP88_45230 [Bradyrhizobium sp. SRL28]|uniref:hypothetical protein n=1 Tax=Bradyrhizobium sp. SRL28 TaxID=2836178 RepID=UPI001BDE432E|nr:hypothetical protein [Bradyrhizobium sp. SRL28]MBT1517495.1 hypothetical protein [Bradyrhizobium sp. SRL28]